ncbi:DUF3054 domain-containing protein [Agromyces sp. Leaf222]|uniref:DUF3054 domain-containing protein n=1 Tax=Agromyces sp. Leaf222 TaxID=1735688 RepID=UPI0006FBA3A3|nr:DUF3054 domain-containing protein [Agromyces sp. Leaf222]KQM82934.1 hypothetical protein ASE68_06435 [Agromyces sp. Leaf222]
MTSPSHAPRSTGAGTIALAAALDAVLVVVFAVIGRSSHGEALDPAGLWGTAWPFLVGAMLGWTAARAWRRPIAVWPTGVIVWVATVVVGMLLRAASGQGTAVAFIIVATLTLALLLLGWRAIAGLVLRLRARNGRPAASGTDASATEASASAA